MESKLLQLTNWIEENQENINHFVYESLLEIIETGETSTSFGGVDWTQIITNKLDEFDIKNIFGYSEGKYVYVSDEQFLTECDYYLFEKEMPRMVAKAEEIVNQIDTTTIQTLESTNFKMKTYLAMAETVEFNWLEVVRTMPDCNKNRKLTDKEKITQIINKS